MTARFIKEENDIFSTFARQFKRMEQKDNLLGVLQTLFKWKKQIIIVCAIAAIGSVIISLFLPVYYKSTTVFLATSPDQAKPEQIFGTSTFEANYYGNENDMDRIMTIAESNELVGFLIDSFDLYHHYRIDSAGAKAAFKVKEKFFGLYNIQKTKRDAIELSVEDKDKELAAQITNTARIKIDKLGQLLIKENQEKILEAIESNIIFQEQTLASLSDSLAKARNKYNIYNTESQSESLAKKMSSTESTLIRSRAKLEALVDAPRKYQDTIILLSASIKGWEVEIDSLRQRLSNFNEGMSAVEMVNRQYLQASSQLSQNKERYKQLKSAYTSTVPTLILVEKGNVPDVKSRPKRSIIVLAVVMIVFLFSILAILIIDTYKDVNWREIVGMKENHGK